VRHRSGRVCAIAAGGQILVTNKAFAPSRIG